MDHDQRLIDFREPGTARTKKRRVATPVDARLLPILSSLEPDGGRVFGDLVDIRSPWRRGTEGARWERVMPHVPKHSCSTRWLRNGVSIRRAAAWSGTSPAAIRQTYGHFEATPSREPMDL